MSRFYFARFILERGLRNEGKEGKKKFQASETNFEEGKEKKEGEGKKGMEEQKNGEGKEGAVITRSAANTILLEHVWNALHVDNALTFQ